jgi:hypothetical protein
MVMSVPIVALQTIKSIVSRTVNSVTDARTASDVLINGLDLSAIAKFQVESLSAMIARVFKLFLRSYSRILNLCAIVRLKNWSNSTK